MSSTPPKPLNPQAQEYSPLSSHELFLTPHLIPLTSSFIPPAFPPSSIAFLHPYFTSINIDTFYPTPSSYLALPPPPQPPSDAFPPTSPVVASPPVGISEPEKVVLPNKVVVTGRKYEPSAVGARKRGSLWFDRRSGRLGRGSGREGLRSRSWRFSIHGEFKADNNNNNNNKNRIYVGKHQMLPLRRGEENTTVMIKNIPYEFNRLMLVEFMDKHCMMENQKTKQVMRSLDGDDEEKPPLSAYDFLYLPIDFGTKKNKGYAFVNFTNPEAAWKFFLAYDGTKWDFKAVSSKITRIVCASIQGKEALVEHFKKSNFECESDEFLPLCFSPPRDGSGDDADAVKLTAIGNLRGRFPCFGRYDQTKP